MDDKKKPAETWTLTDEDISEPTVSRRSALAAVGASFLAALGVLGASTEAEACPRRTGVTNSDSDDRPRYGRTGITDSDSGDAGQCGRGGSRSNRPARVPRRRACTDRDTGRFMDGVGRGRRCR